MYQRDIVRDLKLEGKVKTEFIKYLQKIQDVQNEENIKNVSRHFQIFEEEDWSSRLYRATDDMNDIYGITKRKAYASLLDIQKLIRKLDEGRGEDWFNVLNAFSLIYMRNGIGMFLDDIESLEYLINGLRNLNITDRMLNTARDNTCSELENYLQIMKSILNNRDLNKME